ncbi:MAG: maltose alpha-D-glucosyltransferase [Gemmatimonadota bacterium]|nr:maltose alpha-D-glucosyltransferase [Gemmatimonadota bacterium]
MSQQPGSANDPQWYKDAIIYELHVRCFHDANGDGIGDFRGLIEKLDYLQDLGVTCLWLLPFFPSPLRDDGYDIADYTGIHPAYGTMEDFTEFLAAAHQRGMQVLIELIVNHTSDQHPWFLAARAAPPGSPERDFYVWSDTDQKYAGTRVIFTDTHTSNWTWDPVAGAYFWHRFFSHQPDLNFDNPRVEQEIIRVMQFWLALGVDALRLDAIPYLVEREGTSNENLPETHQLIKRLRAAMDAGYAGRLLLAEANQWPADVRAYFGEDDECQMAFHFPLMPRLFMALRLEDRHPVTEIMRQTPAIPPRCQWGLFLRNHDELTLEMVTDEERDYMYFAYSADPRMRVNVGIRRRLAPLLENDRDRIELLHSILLSFPGTPILYYGDEIGMGDNIYLGDRHGVRTPMQWSVDRNAGFSRANPARLYSPVVMDPVYGYQAVNVEARQSEPSSLLNWIRHMIAIRKLFHVFGRGTIEFLEPTNRTVLAYLRRYEGEQVLCVANLSRFAQPFECDLSSLAGLTPVEMRGYVEFPRIGKTPYPLTLGPYGFLWLELQNREESASPAVTEPGLVLPAADAWGGLLQGTPRRALESRFLPEFIPRQRWYSGKLRVITSCQIEDAIQVSEGAGLLLVAVRFAEEPAEHYVVTVGITLGEAARRLREDRPGAILGNLTVGGKAGVLHDALLSDEFCRRLLALARQQGEGAGVTGRVTGAPAPLLLDVAVPQAEPPVTHVGGEQRNSSIIYGDEFILKLFRRIEPGPNPDAEMIHCLSSERGFTGVPAFAGSLEYTRPGMPPATLGLVQRYVPNQGDGWSWMAAELGRYYERSMTLPVGLTPPLGTDGDLALGVTPLAPEVETLLTVSREAAAVLGRRTGALHLALAEPTGDPAFTPEPLIASDRADLTAAVRQHASAAIEQLRMALPSLPNETVELASRVISLRTRILSHLQRLAAPAPDSVKIRVHGDLHLGQVLRVGADFVILDFEGEPGRPPAERRAKQSPLRDVAGMLRSFGYVARYALQDTAARGAGEPARLDPWSRLWEHAVSAAYLDAYRRTVEGSVLLPADAILPTQLLHAFVLDKALSELTFELANRPAWVSVPLTGIVALLVERPAPAG